MMQQQQHKLCINALQLLQLILFVSIPLVSGFAPSFHRQQPQLQHQYRSCSTHNSKLPFTQLKLSSSSSTSSSSTEVSKMKASELRKELESYGMSTKSYFEKSELVEAVKKARTEGKTPITKDDTDDSSSSSSSSSSRSSSSSSSSSTNNTSSSSSSSSETRKERLAQEMEKCAKTKVGELKKELESYGISTKSFFEKSEFVKAVAEARVDGKKKGSSSSTSSKEEVYDSSYRDVKMQKMDKRMLIGMSPVIDVRLG